MKKLLFSFLAADVLFACNKNIETETVTTILSGKIDNPAGDKLYVTSGENVHEFAVNPDGTFSDTLDLSEGYYSVRHARERGTLYLTPGKNLSLSVDMANFDKSLKFEGEGATESNYLTQKALQEIENKPNSRDLYSMKEAAFTEKIEELRKASIENLNSAKGLSKSFLSNEKQNIDFENLSYVSNYKPAHSYFTKNEDFEQPAAFAEKMAALDMTNEANYKTFLSYQSLVDGHYSNLIGNGEKTLDFLETFNALKSPVIKSGIAASVSYFVKPGNDHVEALYTAIMENSTDEELKEKLTKKYDLLKGLAKGQPSPEFDYKDINGKNVSLKDLAGKNVYIDVWATWCGPCKAEIPHLKEMEAAHHGKNIEFVSISIDKQEDVEKWEKMVAEKELKGVQLFSDKDWKSDFVQEYAIEGIPRFILVNDEGKIVSADAPRPSEKDRLLAMFAETGVQ